MSRKTTTSLPPKVAELARVLDQHEGRYRELHGAADFGEYVASALKTSDEEKITEPLLASLLEEVLGFGKGDYFPQLGKGGLKPDFTPTDLVTHRFVLDAKGSSESLSAHVAQIRVGDGPVEDVASILLPKDLAAFEALVTDRAATVSALLREGRERVERVERLVCALYGLPDDLTDAVVAHAVERAAR